MIKTTMIIGMLLVFTLTASFARAEVSLSAVFSDNMVLQQEMRVPIWGKADPGEKIILKLDKLQVTTITAADGKWRADFTGLKAGGPYTLNVSGKNTLTVQNVLVGEVWFCGGQSNMEFSLDRARDAETEIANADYPGIRMFTGRNVVAATPRDETAGKWVVCSPADAGKFSAVGYFFAREIFRARKVPVGMLNVSAGWTPAEAWMSREALLAVPELQYIVTRWDQSDNPKAKLEYQQQLTEWNVAAEKARAEGKPEPPKPKGPPDPNFIHRASGLWNGAVVPIIPYAIRGAIWYQGETNDSRGYQYRKLFPALINDWRKTWGQGDFPFLFVQVASVLPPDPVPVESEWAELRESQALALKLPNTGMAVTVDIGEEKDVHPKNKQDVGYRLGLWARARVYGEKILYASPMYKSMKVEGNKIRLTFDNVYQGLDTRDNSPLQGFAIAGEDRKFVYAEAKIEKGKVIVWSEKVPNPVAVRYAWANNPLGCNLYNSANLPAAPFRTDDWPAKTATATAMYIDL